MTTVPRRPAFPPSRGKRHNVNTYTRWEWFRAYAVWTLLLPLCAVLWITAALMPRMPHWLTRRILARHIAYTSTHKLDFRIPPDEATPEYMLRWWRIPRNWAFNIYYHIVKRSDDDRALHDHPWWSFSIVLEGGYYEHTVGGARRWMPPGSLEFRRSGKIAHRLELVESFVGVVDGKSEFTTRPARTIFITGPVLRRWGFHAPEKWVDAYDWDEYCDAHDLQGMRVGGGSDAVVSPRNQHGMN